MSDLKLRDYQAECIDTVQQEYWDGYSRQLAALPTGAGKTVIFSNLAKETAPFGPTLIVAHRDELINQAADKMRDWWPDVPIGIVKAERNELGYPVTIASVQSLAREGRMQKLQQWISGVGGFFLFVIDEAHHSTAPSYQYLIDNVPFKLLLGVTATPKRGDKRPMGGIFQKITFSKTLPWMIRKGYLCDFKGIAIYGGIDLGGVRTSHGDYNERDLADRVNVDLRNDAIVEGWMKHAKGRRTLVFAVDVQHAHDLAECFVEAGFKAEAVDGTMQMDKRRGILERFATGETQILTNCNVLTEGYDNPATDCIVMARPTKSDALYIQMLGRGSRLFPGKEYCLVIDVVDNHGKHKPYQLPVLTDGKEYEPDAIRAAGGMMEADRTAAERPVREGKIVEEKSFSLLEDEAKYAWVRGKNDVPMLNVDRDRWLAIVPEIGGEDTHYHLVSFTSKWDAYTKKTNLSNVHWAARYGDIEDAFETGEVWIEQNLPDAAKLALKEAGWKSGPASEGQIQFLLKNKVDYDPQITKGEASKLISQRIARRIPVPALPQKRIPLPLE